MWDLLVPCKRLLALPSHWNQFGVLLHAVQAMAGWLLHRKVNRKMTMFRKACIMHVILPEVLDHSMCTQTDS